MARTVVTKTGTSKVTPKVKVAPAKQPFAPKTAVAIKHPTYATAWEQLEKALGAGFALEAMALAEGILADQLALYLSGPLAEKPIAKDRGGQWPAFYLLVEKWKTELRNQKLEAEEGTEVKALARGVTSWRDNQAKILSALVRSNPATFGKAQADALEAAAKGAQLASGLSAWHAAQG